MATMTITGPGGRTATLNIPEGATEDQIKAQAETVKAKLQQEDAVEEGREEPTTPTEDGAVVEAARAAEGIMDGMVLDGQERVKLLDEIAKRPMPDVDAEGNPLSFQDRMDIRQQAMWDEVPGTHKFLIGVGQSVDKTLDWGLDAVGWGDEEARKAEDAVFEALDSNNQDASDAGELVGQVAQLFSGAGTAKTAGAVFGTAWKLGRGTIRLSNKYMKMLMNYGDETIKLTNKSKAGRNLLKAAQKSDEAAEVAAKGMQKRMDAIDEAVTKVQSLKGGNAAASNPKVAQQARLATTKAQRQAGDRAQREIQQNMRTAQKRAEGVARRRMASNKETKQTLGIDSPRGLTQQLNKEALRKSPGGF